MEMYEKGGKRKKFKMEIRNVDDCFKIIGSTYKEDSGDKDALLNENNVIKLKSGDYKVGGLQAPKENRLPEEVINSIPIETIKDKIKDNTLHEYLLSLGE